jgi:hypothetical protein
VAVSITLRKLFVVAKKSSGSGAGKRPKSFPLPSQKGWKWSIEYQKRSQEQIGNSFCTAIQFGLAKRIQFDNSLRQFSLAKRKRIQFDNSAIRFGNSVWQNEFNLTIRQFGSAIQFGKTNSVWQNEFN